MKKLFPLLFLAALIVLAMPMYMYASDSTNAVLSGGATSFAETLLTYLEGKWPIISTIGTVLFLISEVLGSSTTIKQNAVYQVIFSVLQSLFGKKNA